MATSPEEIAQVIALACLHDPKVIGQIRDEWASDRKIAAMGKKAGIFYKAIHKEVLEAYRCVEQQHMLRDLPMVSVDGRDGNHDSLRAMSRDGGNSGNSGNKAKLR